MEQPERKQTVTIELAPEPLQWLKQEAARRLAEGYPHGERSMGAVIRDLIAEAAKRDEVAA